MTKTIRAMVACWACRCETVIVGGVLPRCATCGIARGWLSVPREYWPDTAKGGPG